MRLAAHRRRAPRRRTDDRPCRLRRLLRLDREARRSGARRQAGHRRRRRAARRRRDLLLCRPHLRRSLGDADGAGAGALSARGRSSSRTWRNMRASAARFASVMRRLTPLVEPLSIDEAFLDLTGCEGAQRRRRGADAGALRPRGRARGRRHRLGRPQLLQVPRQARLRSRQAARLFRRLRATTRCALLAPMGVGRLWGVGKVAEERLARLGLKTIGDLQALDEAAAAARLGEEGRRLWRLARGIDDRRVTPDREAKSVSSETTFEDRRRRQGRADARVARAVRAGGGAIAKGGACGGRRDAEVAHARLQAAHAQPFRARADADGAAAFRRRARAARRAAGGRRPIG